MTSSHYEKVISWQVNFNQILLTTMKMSAVKSMRIVVLPHQANLEMAVISFPCIRLAQVSQ